MRRLLNQIWIAIGAAVLAFVVSWMIYMPDTSERGIWRAQSGGQIITLNMVQAKLYSESSVSCIEQLTFPAHMKLVELAEGARVEVVGDVLLLHVDGSVEPTPFERIPALPDTCGPVPERTTQQEVFDALWAAMDEHYAFFDLHGVNWNERRVLRPDQPLSDGDFFEVIKQTLDGLDDGHIQIVTPDPGLTTRTVPSSYSPARRPEWHRSTMSYPSLWQTARDTIETPLTPVELTGIEYTVLPNGVAYVMIRHMGVDTPFGTTEQDAMSKAFAQVATEIGSANTIIIDLRYNPGGSDTVSFGVAGHFTDVDVAAFTKTTRDGDTQTEPFTARFQPYDDSPLTQPVIVLTSQLTGSAAEILTMALRELPQVTTMGQPTSGGLSDILGFKLPNGWDLGLSHQTYRTIDGTLFEAIGIPPDIAIEIEAAPLLAGKDPLLEAALARAGNRPQER